MQVSSAGAVSLQARNWGRVMATFSLVRQYLESSPSLSLPLSRMDAGSASLSKSYSEYVPLPTVSARVFWVPYNAIQCLRLQEVGAAI